MDKAREELAPVNETAINTASVKPPLNRLSPGQLRYELHRLVLKDLLGPVDGPDEEVDEQRVSDRYLVGMLAPKQQRDGVNPEEQDDLALGGTDDDNGSVDNESSFADSMFPSSFGVTFCIVGSVQKLKVDVSWGQYLREKSDTIVTDKGAPKTVWRRYAVKSSITLDVVEGAIGSVSAHSDHPRVIVKGVVRRADGNWMISVFLVNEQEEPEKRKDEAWLFQPELKVSDPDGQPIFVRRCLDREWERWDPYAKQELQAGDLLYRRYQEFAVGHGMSAYWGNDKDDPNRALWVKTTAVPTYEVPHTDVPSIQDNPALADIVLDMKELSETANGQFTARLGHLADAYKGWIEDRRGELAALGARYNEAGMNAIKSAERALERIVSGITALDTDPIAADAFRFANKAMWLQRAHSIYALKVRRGKTADINQELDSVKNRSWRPFQLAFLLQTIPGLTDLQHPDRDIADLLWFPTGGGKTEAYLGVAAFTMAIRRLQGIVAGRDGGAGVSVLMRYTLRLLTLQQFQRAGALLCAMESLRREALFQSDIRWGKEPFRLGLWVGMKTTPNRTDQAAEAVRRDHGQGNFKAPGATGTPAQLTNCPWCGTKIDAGKHIRVDTVRGRTILYCGDDNGGCLYSEANSPGEGLPVLVVDEEIYRRLPAMLIATVDKFAQMPWNGAVQSLFGQVDHHCPRHGYWGPSIDDKMSHPRKEGHAPAQSIAVAPLRPPDLIIQDELHLISGPLGTLVGLYETAVDELSSWQVDGKKVRPKVISSTATIRRAADQVHALFLRKCEIFPPSGLDIRDNFFSVQRDKKTAEGELEVPGRLYVGICAPGKRLKATLIRVYVAYMSAAQYLYETQQHGAAMDPWMTLVGYFNSLRELGGMRRLVDDDVRTRLRDMVKRGLSNRRPPNIEELTSRMSSSDIPRILDAMEVGFDPKDDAEREQARKEKRKPTVANPVDVLLSSNMISVGVDIQRLGLMVVAGQPKTTAEYIQASSRVGRGFPGLVCTVYNWARPRDLSHYEMFYNYHATFYRHVEAISVTPFAERAMDRGLSALLVSMIRLGQFEMNTNNRAQSLDRGKSYVQNAIAHIRERAALVANKQGISDDVLAALQSRLDEWEARAKRRQEGSLLGYETQKDGVTIGLLKDPGVGVWDPFTCLNSLRDVEPSVAVVLSDKELD